MGEWCLSKYENIGGQELEFWENGVDQNMRILGVKNWKVGRKVLIKI
jgi:hypothetical protein